MIERGFCQLTDIHRFWQYPNCKYSQATEHNHKIIRNLFLGLSKTFLCFYAAHTIKPLEQIAECVLYVSVKYAIVYIYCLQ